MGFNVKTYSADQVTLLVANITIDSGFNDGEFCRVEQLSDDVVEFECTDGEVAIAKTLKRLTKVTILLAQTSDGNAKLSALRLLGLNGPLGSMVGSFLLRDRGGTSLYSAQSSWIAKPPDVSFAREVQSREWTIRCLMDERLDGGN